MTLEYMTDPTDRRLSRLERNLFFWRALAIVFLFIALVMAWVVAMAVAPGVDWISGWW